MNVLRSSLPPHSGSKWLKSAKMFIHLMCFHEFSQLKQRLADLQHHFRLRGLHLRLLFKLL